LRSALLATVNGVEAKVWRRFERARLKRHDQDMAAMRGQAFHRLAQAALAAVRKKLKLPPSRRVSSRLTA
jgi:hypothetical protein